MKKKFLICALLSVAAATASAALAGCNLGEINSNERYRQNHMCFDLKSDGTYELTRYEYADLYEGEDEDGNYVEGYKGEGVTVTVPTKVNGKKVTSIADGAFSGRGVKEVTLPEVITAIPDGLFNRCTLLEKVNFSNVTAIGESAFIDCKSLTSIAFESGLTEIGDRAFYRCTKLTEFDLPESVTAIGRYALGSAETVNYDGTPTQWAAIKKGDAYGRDIWYTDNDLTVDVLRRRQRNVA